MRSYASLQTELEFTPGSGGRRYAVDFFHGRYYRWPPGRGLGTRVAKPLVEQEETKTVLGVWVFSLSA